MDGVTKEVLSMTERIRGFAQKTYTRNISQKSLDLVIKDWEIDYGKKENVNGAQIKALLDQEYKSLRLQNGANY